jgi:hypothetical protein
MLLSPLSPPRFAIATPEMPVAKAAVSRSCFIIALRIWFMLSPFAGYAAAPGAPPSLA